MTRISSTKWNRPDERRHLCLVPDLRVNQSVFHIKYEVSCRFSTDTPLQTEEFPFISYFIESFYHEWCCNCQVHFFTSLWDLIPNIGNRPWVELEEEGLKAAAGGSEEKSLKAYYWIQIANVLLRIFCIDVHVDQPLVFLWCLSGFVVRIMPASSNEVGSVPVSSIFWQICRRYYYFKFWMKLSRWTFTSLFQIMSLFDLKSCCFPFFLFLVMWFAES